MNIMNWVLVIVAIVLIAWIIYQKMNKEKEEENHIKEELKNEK